MEMTQRYTIPYESFKNKSWLYEQEKYLEKVDNLIAREAFSAKEKAYQTAPYLWENVAKR